MEMAAGMGPGLGRYWAGIGPRPQKSGVGSALPFGRFPCFGAPGKIGADLLGATTGMHTHYDNLKISREAPPEVIRAAYKALSQKHHPDRNNGSPESHRNMTIINTAYEVLIDPVRRAQHDAWILAQEQAEKAAALHARAQARPAPAASSSSSASASAKRPGSAPRQASTQGAAKPKTAPAPGGGSGAGKVVVMIIAGVAIYAAFSTSSRAPDRAAPAPAWTPAASAPLPMRALPAAARELPLALPEPGPRYARRPTAPNGYPWPNRSGYVPGYPVLKTNGLSTLTIDNTRNDADVFLKVFSLNAGSKTPVRFAFIKAGASFEFAGIAPGDFDVRYMDLDTGRISRSEPFTLDETAEYNGTQYSKTTLTLYKVPNGNTRTREIGESEF
ncbi:J domain-containing protein [Cupriavidus basilensis]|uniref:J domain-containing protein n=1 Tax=Cupriavidus basilensis TaxID=68895 RepID=UPI001E52FBCB|nr:J domain-containing protein [Cupriavidus basilensis]